MSVPRSILNVIYMEEKGHFVVTVTEGLDLLCDPRFPQLTPDTL